MHTRSMAWTQRDDTNILDNVACLYSLASDWMSFRMPAAVTSAPAPGPETTSGSAR